jgi:NACalpha-BTF3-like transcription factor
MLMDKENKENKESKIAFVSNEDLEERILLVMRQTDYTQQVAREKLTACNYDAINKLVQKKNIKQQSKPKLKLICSRV